MTRLTRWTPSSPDLRDRFTRLVDQMFADSYPATGEEEMGNRNWIPPVDIAETEDQLAIHVELPGMKKDDVDVTLEKNVLTIRGERQFEKDTQKENYHRIERAYGTFYRSFQLPTNVVSDEVSGRFENGVLTVTVPKAEESKPRKVSIG